MGLAMGPGHPCVWAGLAPRYLGGDEPGVNPSNLRFGVASKYHRSVFGNEELIGDCVGLN